MAQVGNKRISKIINHLTSVQDEDIKLSKTTSIKHETYPLSNPSQCFNLSGYTIFITGASRGIGLAVALRCAKDGANIVIAAKTAEPHPKLPGTIYTAAREIGAVNGGNVLPVICDIRKEEMVKNAVQKAVDRFGGIDILINNASAISITNTKELTMKKYDLMHDVNARGTYLVTKYCLPYLIESNKNSHILTMSPPLGYLNRKTMSGKVGYMTAKLGMSLATLGWSEEFKRYKIAANSLWPRTPIATAAVKNIVGGDIVMKRSRTPEIHADAAYLILTQPNNTFSGNFVWDEDILRQSGVTDFAKYIYDKNSTEKDIFRISSMDWDAQTKGKK